tara:strand:- start:116 stop:466 length:351 start_codon:yes stop_codon:yes gene_type:complete
MSRDANRIKFTNNTESIAAALKRRNIPEIEHHSKIDMRPVALEARARLNKNGKKHIFKVGDRLYKIAFDEYGDSKYWYLLAWWNKKPTDFHCKIGDVIYVPKPLQDLLFLYKYGNV